MMDNVKPPTTMIVLVVLVSSKTLTFGLIELERANFRSLLSRRSRRELRLEAKPKILDRLLAEGNAENDELPTYNQATKVDPSAVDRSSACTSIKLSAFDAPLTISTRTDSDNCYRGQARGKVTTSLDERGFDI